MLAGGGAPHVQQALEEGEWAVLGREFVPHQRGAGQNRHSLRPAVGAIPESEQCRPADRVREGAVDEPDRALREHQVDLVLEPVLDTLQPVRCAVACGRSGIDPDPAVAELDREGGGVVGEEIERAAAGEVELGVVPVAGQDAVAHGAAMEREAHVRAAVVQGDDAALGVQQEDGATAGLDDLAALSRQLLHGAGLDELG